MSSGADQLSALLQRASSSACRVSAADSFRSGITQLNALQERARAQLEDQQRQGILHAARRAPIPEWQPAPAARASMLAPNLARKPLRVPAASVQQELLEFDFGVGNDDEEGFGDIPTRCACWCARVKN